MTRKAWWTIGFLGITAVAIALEVFASFDGSPDTVPWTDYIVRYIPGEIAALLIGGLALWLVVHFGLRYYRKHKAAQAAKKEKADEPQD